MNTKKKRQRKLIIVNSLDEIPDHFDSEDDEREWWATHEFGDELWVSLPDDTDELDRIAPLAGGSKRRATS